MKLSKRERRLLVLLAFSALWALAFHYAIVPEFSRMKAGEMQLKRLESRREEIEITLAMKDSMAEMLEGQIGVRAGDGFFYHNLDTVEADLLIQAIAKDAGLGITAMSLQEIQVVNESADGEPETAIDEEEQPAGEELPLDEITVVIDVRGTMAEAMKFLDYIHEAERAMIVSRLDLMEIHDTPDVQGTVTIVVYSLDEEGEEADDGRE